MSKHCSHKPTYAISKLFLLNSIKYNPKTTDCSDRNYTFAPEQRPFWPVFTALLSLILKENEKERAHKANLRVDVIADIRFYAYA